MTPETWDDLLLAYMTGTLTATEYAAFDRLLAECEPCRAELAEWQSLAAAVREDSAARVEPLPPLPAAFYQRLGAQPSINGSHRRSMTEMEENMVLGQAVKEKRKRGQSRPVTLAAAVAAVVLGGLMLLAGRGGPSGPIQPMPLAGVMGQDTTPTPVISATPGAGLDPMMLTATAIIAGATGTKAVVDGIWTPAPNETAIPTASATFVPSLVPSASATFTATPFPELMPTVVPPAASGMQPIVAAPARLVGEAEVNEGIRESGVALSADGQYAAVQTGDHAVQVFTAATLELAATIDLPETTVTAMAFGGSRLAVGTLDGDVLFWSPDEAQADTLDGDGWVTGLAFSGDGRRLVILRSAGNINTLWLYNLDARQQTAVLVYDVPLAGVAFNADGSQIVVGTLDGRVLVLEVSRE